MKKVPQALGSLVAVRRKPSPAFVISCLALLVALAGTASAKTQTGSKPNVVFVKTGFSLSNGETDSRTAECPAGTKVFSGGYAVNGQFTKVFVAAPARGNGANGYLVSALEPPVNLTAGVIKETATITLIAYCAPIGKPIVLGS